MHTSIYRMAIYSQAIPFRDGDCDPVQGYEGHLEFEGLLFMTRGLPLLKPQYT